MKHLLDTLEQARHYLGTEVCFADNLRCRELRSRGITRGVLVNAYLVTVKGQSRIMFVVEFGPSYHRLTSYFSKDDLHLCNGSSPST